MAEEMKVIELKAAATGRVSASGPWLTWGPPTPPPIGQPGLGWVGSEGKV